MQKWFDFDYASIYFKLTFATEKTPFWRICKTVLFFLFRLMWIRFYTNAFLNQTVETVLSQTWGKLFVCRHCSTLTDQMSVNFWMHGRWSVRSYMSNPTDFRAQLSAQYPQEKQQSLPMTTMWWTDDVVVCTVVSFFVCFSTRSVLAARPYRCCHDSAIADSM